MNVDIFGKEVPGFNIKGEHHMSTAVGGIMTFLLLMLSLCYAIIKVIHLVNKTNPVMSELTIPEHYSSLDKFYLNENNFKMAFSVEGYLDRENKNDSRYVKWIARVSTRKGGV